MCLVVYRAMLVKRSATDATKPMVLLHAAVVIGLPVSMANCMIASDLFPSPKSVIRITDENIWPM